MKDPSSEILTAFVTALASITYNSVTWHVYKEQPPKGKRNYIYLSDLSLNDGSDQSHNIFNCTLTIQISTKKDKYARTIANSLSNSIMQALVRVELSMTTYYMIVESFTQAAELSEEIEGSQNYIKQIGFNFQTQEK